MLLSKGCIAFCKTCTVYAPKFVEIVKSPFCFFPVFIVLFDYFSCGWLEDDSWHTGRQVGECQMKQAAGWLDGRPTGPRLLLHFHLH